MLQQIKGSYSRKFQPLSYEENDSKAKTAIKSYLESNGHTILDMKEDYSFDIKSEKNGGMYYSEVEMKNQWTGDWNTKWTEIRIPYRKFKLVNKYKEMQGDNTYCNFFVIRQDAAQAWRIKDFQLTEDCVKEIWLANARRKEYFFHIPYTEAELINLS
jgi:hypothetical protein|tara:strand:- start:163 stop:636 length:474 start_codon:yes stop_codon:yes gene_type:complete